MIDTKKLCKKITEEVISNFNLEDPSLQWIEKFARWWGTTFTPFLITLISFYVLMRLFLFIQEQYGTDRVFIILAIIIIFFIRNLGKTIGELSEKLESI